MINQTILMRSIDERTDELLAMERYLWAHPESGYREWNTNAYLKEKYEALGYRLIEAGNIPGFFVEIDTGRPGPTLAVFGEMDSLIIPTHPECNPVTGAVHACGHHCQSTALYGIACALKAPGALDGLCGKIRLYAVPAEELIELEYREELRKKGVIRYFGGKQEFLARGYLDGVDLAFMMHTGSKGLTCSEGSNGCIIKQATFTGKSCHASNPQNGVNALYAANTAMAAANALRETFRDEDHIRFHPIITEGGVSVNSIPDRVSVESYVRGKDAASMKAASDKINRAFAGAAAAMGCGLRLTDHPGYAPRRNNREMQDLLAQVAAPFFPDGDVHVNKGWDYGCSDFGDITLLIPGIHPNIGGAVGNGHSSEYRIADPVTACVTSARVQILFAAALLENDAAEAKRVIAGAEIAFRNKKEYFAFLDSVDLYTDAVVDNSDGTVSLRYKK